MFVIYSNVHNIIIELEIMRVFTYYLIKLSFLQALKVMLSSLKSGKIEGMIHAEIMSAMVLGSPIFSISRVFSREIIVFAQWETEEDFDKYIKMNSFGKVLSKGWFVKLKFIRQWGNISGF